MKVFEQWELREATKYALTGETAVHLHFIVFPKSPKCFIRDVNKGYPIAHIMSQDRELLVELAKRSGVNKIVVEKENTPRQHVDMCGKPLRFLLEEMGESIEDYKEEKE